MPTDTKTNTEPYETRTSSRGPQAPQRDKSVEHQYAPSPGENNNRTDAKAPGGAVNIKVKGGETDAGGPDAKDQATGKCGRDSSAVLPQA